MKLAIVTAIWKRPKLTRRVLEYYRDIIDGLPDSVYAGLIVAGSEGKDSREIAADLADVYVEVPNDPLGAKWNAAAEAAKEFEPDAILAVGSDDLASRELIEHYMKDPTTPQGVTDTFIVDLLNGKSIHWPGYVGRREGEPVGAGRWMPKAMLDTLDWKPWSPHVNKNLDGSLQQRMAEGGFKFKTWTMRESGDLYCMKHRTSITPFSYTRGEAVTAGLPAWTEDFRRTWSLGFDMLAKGDAVAGTVLALHSVAGLCDETSVLVDSRYDGNAIAAAELCDAHTIERPAEEYEDTGRVDFSAARNYLLTMSETDWCFVLDADEVLIDRGDLLAAIDIAEEQGVKGVSVAVQIDETVIRQIRAFRRDVAGWRFPIHNQLTGIETAVASTAVIRTSYAGQHEERRERARPVLERMWESGDAEEKEHAAYFLAKAAASAGDFMELFRWTPHLMEMCPDKPSRAAFWVWQVQALRMANDLETAAAALTKALSCHPKYDGLHYLVVMLSAAKWATMPPTADYALVPTPSRVFVHGFNRASEALGWGMEVDHA